MKSFINYCFCDEYIEHFKKNSQIKTADRLLYFLACFLYDIDRDRSFSTDCD